MPRPSDEQLFHMILKEAKNNVIRTSGKCHGCDKERKLLLNDKTAIDCFPTCVKCLVKAVKELRTD